MRKKILVSALFAIMMMSFAGCSQASRVSSNLSQEADNFNDVRQLTVINCLQGDTLFWQITFRKILHQCSMKRMMIKYFPKSK